MLQWSAAETMCLQVFPSTGQLGLEPGNSGFGDLTLAALRIRGHGAGSDTPFERPIWILARWRDKKVASRRSFETEAEALAAVNVMKQGPPR